MKKILTLLIIASLCPVLSSQAQEAGKTYRLTSAAQTSRSLFVKNSSLSSDAAVVAWTETDVPAQQWTLQATDDGHFRLVNVLSGLFLSRSSSLVTTSVTITQTNLANDRSEWNLTAIDGTANAFTISPACDGGEAFAISSTASSDGATVKFANIDQTNQQQQWTLVEVEPWDKVSTKMRNEAMQRFLDHFEQARTSELSTLGSGGGWGDAEMMETILDALEVTGKQEYADLFERVYGYTAKYIGTNYGQLVYNDDYKWYGHEFNDDAMWLVIAAARASFLTGQSKYQSIAKANFNTIYNRAILSSGLMRWKEGNGDGTTSCINCPTIIAACYLAKATGDESFYDKARALYQKQRAHLVNPSDGHVFDSTSADDSGKYSWNTWASTYNQGTFMGAALLLYEHYRDPMYAQDASLAFEYTRKNLCDNNEIVNVCQTVSGDLCGFKGILMRYVRRLAVDLNRTDAMEWLQKNALFAFSNRNSDGITSSAWLTKAGEDYELEGISDSNFNGQAFGCSTMLSAVFNAPLSAADFQKDAYKGFEAEQFNYTKGMRVVDGTAGDNEAELSGGKTNYFVAYNNVDFGQQAATQISLRFSPVTKNNSKIEIYVDSLSGQLLGTIATDQTSSWQTLTADIAPIDGVHAIYLKFRNASVSTTDPYHIDRIQFSSSLPAFTASLMSNAGSIKSPESVDNPAAIIDSHLSTEATISANSASIIYKAPAKASVGAYAISAPSAVDFAPTEWTLYGSNDGEEWTQIDRQAEVAFSYACETKTIELSQTASYRYFRLNLANTSEAESMKLSEFQLFGTCLSASDITSDGGSYFTDTPNQKIYQSESSYLLTAYSITPKGIAPTDWTLEGLSSGEWETIDSQHSASFRSNHPTQFYNVAPSKAYSDFRLTTSGSTDDVQLQLFGALTSTVKMANGILYSGGEFSSSNGDDADQLKAITDKDANTCVTLPFGDNCYLQYKAPMAVKPLSFGVMGGTSKDNNPSSVQLDGSNDGQTWTKIAGLSLGTAKVGQLKEQKISSTKTYTYFRLTILKLNSADAANATIAEWQLNGTAIDDAWSVATPSNITVDGVIASTSEDTSKLYDASSTTKLCYQCFVPSVVSIEMPEATKANVLAITAANDDEGRDPKAWTLEASHDGETWTTLDLRTDVSFKARYATQFYAFNNNEAYRYYRMTIAEVQGNDRFLCQMAELQLGYSQLLADGITAPSSTPQNLNAPQISYNAATHQLTCHSASPATLTVYDATGRTIATYRPAAGIQTVSLNGLASSLYIVKASTNKGSKAIKIAR